MADIGAMSQEELTTFRFIAACEDKQLRKHIFDLKRKDATAVREAIAQYQLQQKAEEVLQAPAPVAVVTQQKQGGRGQRGQKPRPIPPQLLGKCTSCGDPSHMAPTCNVKKRGMKCSNCGRPGHLAKVCFSIVRKQSTQGETRPIRAVTETLDVDPACDEAEPWVKRLTLNISHRNGSFTFNTFPDTGSAATLIASDLAKKYGIQSSRPPSRKYISVNGDPVATDGTAPVNLSISNRSIDSVFVISPALTNEIIIG